MFRGRGEVGDSPDKKDCSYLKLGWSNFNEAVTSEKVILCWEIPKNTSIADALDVFHDLLATINSQVMSNTFQFQ